MAFLAACHPEIAPDIAGIAAINMDGDWPFPELSPLRQMERLQSPLLIVDGLANRNVTPSAAMVLPERAQQYGKTVEVISILGMGHDPGERWPEVLSGVAGFFETVYPKARRKGGVDP
jgi:dipeptidyl aminopeptidase/acylaminoacyl peptidase